MHNKGDIMISFVTSRNDEYFTPRYGVEPILKYIPSNAVVWCPFDSSNSQFVKCLQAKGDKVVYTHIQQGYDFLNYEPQEHYDCIVSNPPYTKKNEIMLRLKELGKPFAMLLIADGIFESKIRFNLMRELDVDVLIMDKRINFLSLTTVTKQPSFSTWYVTYKMLPSKIVYEEIDKSIL